MSYRLFISLLFFISSASFANNVTVYRWVDENNVVHYSQQQPEHDDYTELTIDKDFKSNQQQAQQIPKQPMREQAVEPDFDGVSNGDKCEQASTNLKTLTEFDHISYETVDGEVKRLSEKEKKQQTELTRKEVEIYCSK